ncbi:MAG: hypothetical protein ABI599_10210 [Flavobacteriales bacterium]
MNDMPEQAGRGRNGWPENLRAFLFLAVCVLVAWWPLSTFTYAVAHGDMLDCWLPWRTFIADCLQNGEWPVWNPYQQMGYPVHADLQGPAWYPEALLLGGTIGQGIYVLQALVIIYLLVAGMGMYRLAKQFCGSHTAALTVGAAYMLSGFFTAHVMHQYSFISGAWWPWMFAAFLRLLQKPGWRPALEAAVFQFLLLTGGNHTFTIIGSYLMLALIAVRGVQFLRSGERRSALSLCSHLLLFASASLIMACGVLHAWWYSAPFIARTGGIDYGMAAQNPFTWKAALSFLIPWATTGGPEITGTNITMANASMGLVMLVLLPLAFLRKRSAFENVLLVFGAVCLLASFGDSLPVHRWLFSVLPGMNVFRFPSYFTFFTLLCWLLPVARTLAAWNELPAKARSVLLASSGIVGAIISVFVVRACSVQVGLGFTLDDAHTSWFERMDATSMAERTMVHGLLQLLILTAFATMAFRPKWFTGSRLLSLVAVEGVIAVLLCSWQTGVSNLSPSVIDRIVEMRPKGFPLPDRDALGANKDDDQDLQPLWRNTNIFQKRISHDGFNSFWPEGHLQLQQRWPELFEGMKKQPFAYIADSVVKEGDFASGRTSTPWGNTLAVLPDSGTLPSVERLRPVDSCIGAPSVTNFSNTSMTVTVEACRKGLLVIQQQNLAGWTALLNGTPAAILNVNGCAMGIAVERGAQKVELNYSLPALAWLRGISWAVFISILFLLAFTAGSATRVAACIGLSAMVGSAAWAFFGHGPVSDPRTSLHLTCPDTSGATVLFRNAFDKEPVDTTVVPAEALGQGVLALVRGRSDWSPAFEVAMDKFFATKDDALVIEARYKVLTDSLLSGESFIVLSVEDGGQFSFYRTKPLRIAGNTDGWSTSCLIVQAQQLRRKTGKVKAYVWNNGSGIVLLDDLKVSVMPWGRLGASY